jgi:hypothetical protein
MTILLPSPGGGRDRDWPFAAGRYRWPQVCPFFCSFCRLFMRRSQKQARDRAPWRSNVGGEIPDGKRFAKNARSRHARRKGFAPAARIDALDA